MIIGGEHNIGDRVTCRSQSRASHDAAEATLRIAAGKQNNLFFKGVVRVYKEILDDPILKYHVQVTSDITDR